MGGRGCKGSSAPGGVRCFFTAAAVLIGLALCFFAAGRLKESLGGQETAAAAASSVRIVIDPGHGGADGGAVGIDGVEEKGINLSIALKLRDLLLFQGYEVVMTRETDRMTCDEGLSGITAQKRSDMYNRLALMDAAPSVVLSIHQNQFEREPYDGAQMFYGKNDPFSETLAAALQAAFVKNLQPGNTREIKKGGKDLFLLDRSENPIVLVECGFLSNRAECARLQEDEYQGKVAFTIMEGLMTALGQKNSGAE